MRSSKTFTIDEDVKEYIDSTKHARSASERVNELLRRAILLEREEELEAEAAAFFEGVASDDEDTKAFRKASLRTFAKD